MTTDAQFIKRRLPELRLAGNKLVAAAPSPKTRTTPYFVRGREPELAYLTQLIHSLPKPVQAIVGLPGIGKSTLLSYLALYAARHGYEVVQLEPEHFRSMELLVQAIRPEQLATISKTRSHNGEIDVQVACGGTTRETTVTEAMVASMTSAIRERAQSADKGLVILVDEFQNLARHDDHTKDIACCFINYMHSSVSRTEGLRSGKVPAICIVAGLLNLVDAAHELGATRLSVGDCIRLGPIAQRHAEQIIRDHLGVRGRGIPTLAKVDKPSIARIAAACEGYPHHLTIAGWKTQSTAKSARATGHDVLTSEMVDKIMTEIDRQKRQLYESRWTVLRSKKERYAALAIADIMDVWDNRVPAPILSEAMDLVANAMSPGAEGPMDGTQLTKRMERAGIMEERTDASNFPAHDGVEERNHFCMPIPSLATYIQKQRKSVVPRNSALVTYDDLMIPGALDEEPIPAWEWRDRINPEDVADLPEIPPVTVAIRRSVKMIRL